MFITHRSKPKAFTRAVLAGVFVAIGVVSCSQSGTSCDDIDFTQFDNEVLITGIDKIDVFRLFSNGALQALDENSVTSVVNLKLHIKMNYVRQRRAETAARFSILDWLIGSANACSIYYEGDMKSRVIDVDLYSNASLGDGYEAGSSLEASFNMRGQRVSEINYGPSYGASTVSMPTYQPDNPITAEVEYILRPQFPLSAIPAPTATELHQFTFSITLETGEMFTATSNSTLIPDSNP